MPSAWPTTAELTTAIEAMGGTAPSSTILQAYLDASVAVFDHATGYRPFLAGSTGEARLFDPPKAPTRDGLILEFGSGLLSCDSIYVGWDTEDNTGTLLVAEQDYVLGPYARSGAPRPYTEVRIKNYPIAEWLGLSIKVTGQWGYSATIPSDAWLAVLNGSARAIQSAGGPVSRIKQGPVEMEFAIGITSAADSWADEIRACASRYRLIQL